MDKVREGYGPNTLMEANFAPRTNREKEYYYRVFNLDDVDLINKNVLDVGAGDSNFAQKVAHLTNVIVQLDAQYQQRGPAEQEEAVAGILQALPFKDESFDLVVASYSVMWIPYQELEKSLTELLRVTKTGGRIKIHEAEGKIASNLPPQMNFDTDNGTLEITKKPGISEDQWRKDIRFIMGIVQISPDLSHFSGKDSAAIMSFRLARKLDDPELIRIFPGSNFKKETILINSFKKSIDLETARQK